MSEQILEVLIEPMVETDSEEAIKLVRVAMNPDEADWARETLKLYFEGSRKDVDTGREYYVWRNKGRICGLVGLHRYVWGPAENVWLSWFAVDPDLHGKGAGSAMISAIEKRAVQAGYRKLFVETYESPTFETARSFYKAKGFCEMGRIENYLPDGSAMIVFGKIIC